MTSNIKTIIVTPNNSSLLQVAQETTKQCSLARTLRILPDCITDCVADNVFSYYITDYIEDVFGKAKTEELPTLQKKQLTFVKGHIVGLDLGGSSEYNNGNVLGVDNSIMLSAEAKIRTITDDFFDHLVKPSLENCQTGKIVRGSHYDCATASLEHLTKCIDLKTLKIAGCELIALIAPDAKENLFYVLPGLQNISDYILVELIDDEKSA